MRPGYFEDLESFVELSSLKFEYLEPNSLKEACSMLDQYKEKAPKDATIREKFNTYRFADHKAYVIDLLKCVTRVSIETMTVTEEMRAEKR